MSSMPTLRAVQSTKLSDQVSRQLLRAIATGQYRAGENLPTERQLAEIFQTSRVVVREALTSLAAKGIIDIRQGRGSIVNAVDQWNTLDPDVLIMIHGDEVFDELLEVRRILEPELAALAAARLSPDELEQLRAICEQSLDETVEQHVEHDTTFHLCIAQSAHNPVLLIMISTITPLLRESRRRTFMVAGELAKASAWHDRVFQAIEKGDAEGARRSMAAHLDQVQDAFRRYRDGDLGVPPAGA